MTTNHVTHDKRYLRKIAGEIDALREGTPLLMGRPSL
jgi:hypothetical protein